MQTGAPLLEIGDPGDLEVVADLLSTDAVQIDVGAEARIDGWGGGSVRGRVTKVDPAGFLKVSALGVEEQRVRVTIDFVDPPDVWSRLGHDYRVVVHVVVWRSDDAVVAPGSSLGVSNVAVTGSLAVTVATGVLTVIFPDHQGDPS